MSLLSDFHFLLFSGPVPYFRSLHLSLPLAVSWPCLSYPHITPSFFSVFISTQNWSLLSDSQRVLEWRAAIAWKGVTSRGEERVGVTGVVWWGHTHWNLRDVGDCLMRGWKDEVRNGERLRKGWSGGKEGTRFEVAAEAAVTEKKRKNEAGFEET